MSAEAPGAAAPYDDHDFGGASQPVDIPDHVEPYSSRDDGGAQGDTAPFADHIDPVEPRTEAPG